MIPTIFSRLSLFRAITFHASSTSILPVIRPSPTTSITNIPRRTNLRLFHHFPARLTNSSPSSRHESSSNTHIPLPPNATLSKRLKYLIQSYGWYALGVYSVLAALDFGVAFAGINLLGAEYVSQVVMNVRETVANILHSRPAEPGLDEIESTSGHPSQGSQGVYAMLGLAYAVHKTLFFPIRVGLTAALTPKLVGWLNRRGWAGSEGTRRVALEMRERLRERRDRHN